MVHQGPSIQSYFNPKPSPQKGIRPRVNDPTNDGFVEEHHGDPLVLVDSSLKDGFTEEEIESALHPTLHAWQPRAEYRDVDIGSLIPGPGCIAMMGRIVNFYDMATPSKKPQAARGCLKVVIKDDTGCLVVKLWYAKIDYELRLGQLVSVWTPHVSNAEASSLTMQNAALMTSVFPERDNSCYFLVQENSDDGTLCKTPLGYKEGKELKGLMTLKSFIEGGYDVPDGKILVCVKSIGGRKKFITKKDKPAEKVDMNVFDDTSEATLTLWSSLTASVSAWTVSQTLLLITNATFRSERRPALSVGSNTHVEVDPVMEDSEWLRKYAQGLTKREHVNLPFPEDVFDVEALTTSENRILFTLADIDEFVRAAPHEQFMGYFSLLIMDLNITRLHQRNMLCCEECCGVPIFANSTTAQCKHCECQVPLRINPRLIGTLTDETGSIASGKLTWSPCAWEQLLGRTAEQLVCEKVDVLRYLEYRMLFLRIAMMFGWAGSEGLSGGRLVVLGVR